MAEARHRPSLLVDRFRATDWAAARASFQWPRPAQLNIGRAICGVHADATPEAPALLHLKDGDLNRPEVWTFRALDQAANRAANAFAALGVARGDRVVVMGPQGPAAAAALIGAFKLGAVATPFSTRFGVESLAPRLEDARPRLAVVDQASLPAIAEASSAAHPPPVLLCIDGPGDGATDYWSTLAEARDVYAIAETGPDDPALLCYTSGTTGGPKGALHGHRVLLGHLPGAQLWTEGLGQAHDVAWTPSEWAWLGGIGNMMMPALHARTPLVADPGRFDPERAVAVMAATRARLAFAPPTALRLMRGAWGPKIAGALPALRAIGSAGEALGADLYAWAVDTFGVSVNEFYGQTECNMTLCNSAALERPAPGAAGRPTPGFDVVIRRPDGAVADIDEPGEIAVRRGAPGAFLGYWNNQPATDAAHDGDWLMTGDAARMGADGAVRFQGRLDDIIAAAGYRIGPNEIEDCLGAHPAVAMAAAVGAPDAVRGEAVAVFVTVTSGAAPTQELADTLRAFVRARIGGHATPRDVRFLETLPLTPSGKIKRGDLRRIMRNGPEAR